MDNLMVAVNKILLKNYPIKITSDKIKKLSHFGISSNNPNKFISVHFDINGTILSGKYANYKIIKVITTKALYWMKYLCLYNSILNVHYNPCVNENRFLFIAHTYNYIDELCIKKIIIKKNNDVKVIDIQYLSRQYYHLPLNDLNNNIIINNANHFYLNSFDVNENHKQLKFELDRLIKYRDKYNSIHFHLDGNGGGDIVPAHLILRCLVGKKEKWMKNIKKMLKNKKIFEWDCWKEEDKNSPNCETVKKINLKSLPNYNTKYNGKIYLYMSKINGSAAWFFITYMIYAFGGNVNRYNKKCYGETVKYGSLEKNNKIKIIGNSGTTSGDGNSVKVQYENMNIYCPTEQFISCSIKNRDWNRFWIQ